MSRELRRLLIEPARLEAAAVGEGGALSVALRLTLRGGEGARGGGKTEAEEGAGGGGGGRPLFSATLGAVATKGA